MISKFSGSFCSGLLLGSSLLLGCMPAWAQNAPQEPVLSVRIELRTSVPPTGTVVLRNAGVETIRVWRRGYSWGDRTISFIVQTGSETQKFIEKTQSYTRNVPAYDTLAAGQKVEIRFDLSDGFWLPQWEPGGAKGGTLTATYKVKPTPESAKYGVWTGEIVSEPVKLD
jgi:hypothetical protein